MNKKRLIQFVGLACVLVLFGFGCKGLSDEEQAAIRPVTLDYWTVFHDTSELRALATSYQSIRPYVTVNIRQVGAAEFDDVFIRSRN